MWAAMGANELAIHCLGYPIHVGYWVSLRQMRGMRCVVTSSINVQYIISGHVIEMRAMQKRQKAASRRPPRCVKVWQC